MNINEFNMFYLSLMIAVYLFSIIYTAYVVKISVQGVVEKRRKRKRDQRIIQLAKAANVWDKPDVLGGRALELKAWQDYKIKRKPGETDACLRRRCMTEAENEYTNTPEEKSHDE